MLRRKCVGVASRRHIWTSPCEYISYLLWKFGKERRKERWMIVIDKPYHDACWWYESVNLSRRFVIIVLAALPLDHKVKLILLTISIIFLKLFTCGCSHLHQNT